MPKARAVPSRNRLFFVMAYLSFSRMARPPQPVAASSKSQLLRQTNVPLAPPAEPAGDGEQPARIGRVLLYGGNHGDLRCINTHWSLEVFWYWLSAARLLRKGAAVAGRAPMVRWAERWAARWGIWARMPAWAPAAILAVSPAPIWACKGSSTAMVPMPPIATSVAIARKIALRLRHPPRPTLTEIAQAIWAN